MSIGIDVEHPIAHTNIQNQLLKSLNYQVYVVECPITLVLYSYLFLIRDMLFSML